jgi:plasmid stabilization system protein ParE
VKVLYRQSASDDIARQFRYYLVTINLPEVAVRFRDAVRRTVQWLRLHPLYRPRLRVIGLDFEQSTISKSALVAGCGV